MVYLSGVSRGSPTFFTQKFIYHNNPNFCLDNIPKFYVASMPKFSLKKGLWGDSYATCSVVKPMLKERKSLGETFVWSNAIIL